MERVKHELAALRDPIPLAVFVAVSKIPHAGLGAFAVHRIPSGTVLDEYAGVHAWGTAARAARGAYVAFLGSPCDHSIDAEALETANWTRYINSVVLGDGRKPNAAFARGKVDGEAHEILIVRTIADVQANEELLVDYGLDYWTRAEVETGKKKGQHAQHNGQ